MQPGRNHELAAGDRLRLARLPDLEPEQAAADALDALYRRPQDDLRAVRLRLALQRQHVGVAVDDAGRGREKSRHTVNVGLEGAGLLRGQLHQVVDTVGDRVAANP